MDRIKDIYRVPNADSDDPEEELRLTLEARHHGGGKVEAIGRIAKRLRGGKDERLPKRFRAKPVRSMGGVRVKGTRHRKESAG